MLDTLTNDTLMTDTVAIQERIGELCHQFPAAHHGCAVGVPLHCSRPRRRPGDSPGSTGAGGRGPQAAAHQQAAHRVQATGGQDLGNLRARPGASVSQTATGGTGRRSFVDRGVNVLAFGLPGTGKTHALCAVGHRLVESGRSCSSPRPTGWCRTCWQPSGTWPCRDNYGSSTATTSCCWTTWATCPRGPRSRSCSSPSSQNATSASRPGHHLQPGLLPVGAHLRQPHGHCGGIAGWSITSVILEFNVPSYRTGVAQQRGQDKEVNRQD